MIYVKRKKEEYYQDTMTEGTDNYPYAYCISCKILYENGDLILKRNIDEDLFCPQPLGLFFKKPCRQKLYRESEKDLKKYEIVGQSREHICKDIDLSWEQEKKDKCKKFHERVKKEMYELFPMETSGGKVVAEDNTK